MMLLPTLLLSSAATTVYHSSPAMFAEWMGGVENVPNFDGLVASDAFTLFRRTVIKRFKQLAEEALAKVETPPAAQEYPYFRWIPPYVTSVIPDGPTVSWSNKCFKNNTAKARTVANGTIVVEITTAKPANPLCKDFYLFATLEGLAINEYTEAGTDIFLWSQKNATVAEKFDTKTLGIRICRFVENREETWASVLATVGLFVSEATKDVPVEVQKANLDFLKKYRGITMEPRVTQEVIIDPSEIHSGDFFGIIRLDGLDPMLAWAMGSTTGHTTTALWIGGQLYICESTTKDSYWPTNGIQKTPYLLWLKQAKEAGYQVVHAPLKPEFRKIFNTTKAIEYFNSVEGYDYGFFNLLWGWVDTIKDNYPCVPPDYTQCLQWEHVPILFANVANTLGSAIGGLLTDQAFSHRVGSTGLNLAEAMMEAQKKGIDLKTLPSIVEQDTWLYNTTRFGVPGLGPSMVCCVFVCNVWKAAGIFDSINKDLNCAEMTNWDDYSLTLFEEDSSLRAQACKSADPANPTCQLEGLYTLQLDRYHTKDMYPHIAEHCPSLGPLYEKPPKC